MQYVAPPLKTAASNEGGASAFNRGTGVQAVENPNSLKRKTTLRICTKGLQQRDINRATISSDQSSGFQKPSMARSHSLTSLSSISSTPSPTSTVSPSPVAKLNFVLDGEVHDQTVNNGSKTCEKETGGELEVKRPKAIVPPIVAELKNSSRSLASPLFNRMSLNSPVNFPYSRERARFHPYVDKNLEKAIALEENGNKNVDNKSIEKDSSAAVSRLGVSSSNLSEKNWIRPDFVRSRTLDGIEKLTPQIADNADNDIDFEVAANTNSTLDANSDPKGKLKCLKKRRHSKSFHVQAPPPKIIAKYAAAGSGDQGTDSSGIGARPSGLRSVSCDLGLVAKDKDFVVPSPPKHFRQQRSLFGPSDCSPGGGGGGSEGFQLNVPPLIRATSPILKQKFRRSKGSRRRNRDRSASPLLNVTTLPERFKPLRPSAMDDAPFDSNANLSHPGNIDVCGLSDEKDRGGSETPIPDMDADHSLLPTVDTDDGYQLKQISCDTLARLLKGGFSSTVKKYVIVDCRFEYEYKGGHIRGALNLVRPEAAVEVFFKNSNYDENTCILFHCEFSSHRAPKLMKAVRSLDRKIHEEEYPKLYYPQLYLIEGGYKQFFHKHPAFCEPRGYVAMVDDSYSDLCRSTSTMVRMSWKRHKSFDTSMLRHSSPAALLDLAGDGPILRRTTSHSEGAPQ